MIKNGSIKDMTDFLETPNELSSKNRRQINKTKQIAILGEISSSKTINSSSNSLEKKELPVFILTIIK